MEICSWKKTVDF